MPDWNRSPEDCPEQTSADERIRDEIIRRLAEHSQVEGDRIQVTVLHCEVRLTGIATNRFAKRKAEQLAHDVPDVRAVRNEIHIQAEQEEGGPILTTHLPNIHHGGSNPRSS